MAHPDQSSSATDPEAGPRFRKNLVRVLSVQIISLILLWLLQQHYTA
jgi:hypothetical protein